MFPTSIREVFDVFEQIIDPFFYNKKKSTSTLKKQNFINYMEAVVQLLTAKGPILTGKCC